MSHFHVILLLSLALHAKQTAMEWKQRNLALSHTVSYIKHGTGRYKDNILLLLHSLAPFKHGFLVLNPIASKRAGLFYESAPWSLLQIAHGAKWQNLPDSYVYILVSILALCTSFLHFKFFHSQRNIRLLWTIPKVLSWKRNICDAFVHFLSHGLCWLLRLICARRTKSELLAFFFFFNIVATEMLCFRSAWTSPTSLWAFPNSLFCIFTRIF